jgi:hypothetical protein
LVKRKATRQVQAARKVVLASNQVKLLLIARTVEGIDTQDGLMYVDLALPSALASNLSLLVLSFSLWAMLLWRAVVELHTLPVRWTGADVPGILHLKSAIGH